MSVSIRCSVILKTRVASWLSGVTERLLRGTLVTAVGVLVCISPAWGQVSSYEAIGHINTFDAVDGTAGGGAPANGVLIKVDAGLPGNCSGTDSGWMWIPASSSAMTAYVIGLWLSGNAGSVQVTVYTVGLASNGFCQVVQVQPAS